MFKDGVQTRVLLPQWIYQEARDKEHFKQLVQEYMQRYEGYVVKSIKDVLLVAKGEIDYAKLV